MNRSKTNRHLRSLAPLALAAILFGLFGSGMVSLAAQTAQTAADDPVALVRAFWDAYNNRDITAMQGLVDPGFRFVVDPRERDITPDLPAELTIEQFVEHSKAQVTINSSRQTAPDSVVTEFSVSGEGIPPLPHPFLITCTATVTKDRITRIVEKVSDQTIQDLLSLASEAEGEAEPGAAAGMPKTGTSDQALPGIIVLGLMLLAGGVLIKRAASPAR